MPMPQCSTITPMVPTRRLFIRMVIGMLERNSSTRFHSAALKKYAMMKPSVISGNR